MKTNRKKLIAFFIAIFLFSPVLISCKEAVNTSRKSVTDWNEYLASINIAKYRYTENESIQFGPVLDNIVYDGNDIDLYLELYLTDMDESKNVDAMALFFLDGFLLESSIDGSDKALSNIFSFKSNELTRVNFKCVPVCYDDVNTHVLTAVVIPNFDLYSSEYAVNDTIVLTISKEVVFEEEHISVSPNIVQMNHKKMYQTDDEDRLFFSQDNTGSEFTFYCYEQGDTFCYLFCNGELVSENEKYIFASENNDLSTLSFSNLSTGDIGHDNLCFVLYVNRTNYDLTFKSNNFYNS